MVGTWQMGIIAAHTAQVHTDVLLLAMQCIQFPKQWDQGPREKRVGSYQGGWWEKTEGQLYQGPQGQSPPRKKL